jgi:hypothetical protein
LKLKQLPLQHMASPAQAAPLTAQVAHDPFWQLNPLRQFELEVQLVGGQAVDVPLHE